MIGTLSRAINATQEVLQDGTHALPYLVWMIEQFLPVSGRRAKTTPSEMQQSSHCHTRRPAPGLLLASLRAL